MGKRWTHLAGALAAAVLLAASSYGLGHRRGAEAVAWSADEFHQVACGTQALIALGHLESDRSERAVAVLDAAIDAGISAHWLRLRAPEQYAENPRLPPELVDFLAEHRARHPSAAAAETPTMNELVADYLAHREARPAN